jgi:hypothetical protein
MSSARAAFTHQVELFRISTSGISYVNTTPNDQASLEQNHESVVNFTKNAAGDVTITWARSAYLNINTDTYTVTTSSSGYGIVAVTGYKKFSFADVYDKPEIDDMIPKIGVIRLDGSNMYLKADSRSFPAGTVIVMNHYYVGGGSGTETSLTLSRDTTNTTASTVIGGMSPGRWQANISGNITIRNALAKGAEILLGTVSIAQSSTTNSYARSIAYGLA